MKCRQKKKETLEQLQITFEQTRMENDSLEKELYGMGAEIERMRGLLAMCAKQGGCRVGQ